MVSAGILIFHGIEEGGFRIAFVVVAALAIVSALANTFKCIFPKIPVLNNPEREGAFTRLFFETDRYSS